MQINIDQEAITTAINQAATKALSASLGGFELQKAVGEIVGMEVARGAIADAVKLATQRVDTSKLADSLAKELERAATATVVTLVREAFIDMVCRLRGIGNYGEDIARREAVKLELERTWS